MVNTQVLQGQWNQVRGQLKKKWGQLTEDDLKFTNGNIDQLVGRIQHKTGEAREAIEGFLDELTSQGRWRTTGGCGRPGTALPLSRFKSTPSCWCGSPRTRGGSRRFFIRSENVF
jgi:uncharacterized protein YjbJ (UPF0337 family)